MKKKLLFITLLFNLILFAQNTETQTIVYGRLISDTINVYNASIINKNTKYKTNTSEDGSFKIPANANDTLYISHKNISPMIYIVEDDDFMIDLKIMVYEPGIQLDEIVIFKTGENGVLTKGLDQNIERLKASVKKTAQQIKGYDFKEELEDSRKLIYVLNNNTPGSIKTNYTNVDFKEIGLLLYKNLFKNKKPKQSEAELIKNRIVSALTIQVLSEQLNMSENELELYINFLTSNGFINAEKIDKTSSLDLLALLLEHKNVYHLYLLSLVGE